jgi:hypothetical protein
MHTLKTLASTMILVVAFGVISMDALAKKPVSSTPPGTETQTVLSNKEALNFAKIYLPAFQAVDPNITLNHLKSYILGLNTTDPAQIDAAMQSYLLSIQPAPPANQAPSISGSPATLVDEGIAYSFTPSASDPEGDSLLFAVANKPAWAAFDSATGRLSGTPGPGSAGVYGNILISVSDGQLSDSLPAFDISVKAPITTGAPTLVSAAVSGSDVLLSWNQESSMPDGGFDVFIDGSTTGALYRTSSTSQSVANLDLTQSHCFMVEARYIESNEFLLSNQLCTEAQLPPNQPPQISGTPQSTVSVGESYSFTPTGSDADGDVLSYSIINRPSWASFDNQTGTLYGTPQALDAGSYAEIEIRVSDGTDSASLAPFTLVVQAQQTTGSATLSWVPPATRTDGTSLAISEIDGYRIYMGDTQTTLLPVMDVNDSSVTQFTLTDITTGTYYFSVTAYDTDGNESGLSNIVSKSTL